MRLIGVVAALLWAVLPIASIAQECVAEDKPGCPAGLEGKCPLGVLFEDFVSTPTGYVVPPVAERPFNPDAGDRLLIKRFLVEGVRPNPEIGITPESVQAVADAAWKRIAEERGEVRLTVGQMVRVADEVTTFYRNQGYIVAKAFIPVQAVGADNVVKIQVLEGTIAAVEVTGASDYATGVLSRPASRLVGAAPTRESLESALLYAQDYPGVRLYGTFRPGEQSGETKLVLQVLGEDRVAFDFGGDNYGNEFTGVYRARLDVDWNNPIGWGDRLGLSVLQAMSPENTTFGSLDYTVPLGPRGFAAFFGASHNQFAANEDVFAVLQLEGTIDTYEAGMRWNFLRSRFFNARTGVSYASKHSELTAVDTITVTDDTLNVVNISAGLDRVDTRYRGVDDLSFTIRQGAGGEINSNDKLDPNFTAFELRFARLQALTETQALALQVRAQETSNTLLSLERFTLSGPSAVRAYPVGEFLADKGQFASLEYRVQAPGFAGAAGPFGRTWGDLLQTWLFYDYGAGQSAEGTSESIDIAGYGLALQFGVPGSFRLLLQGAKPTSSVDASDGKDVRAFAEFSVQF